MKTSRIQWCPEAQQQAILALGTALDAPSDADRAFFTRHPERDYLVRRARKVELRANEIVMGGKLQKPDGFRWYYAVQRVEFGRMKSGCSRRPRCTTPSGSPTPLAGWSSSRSETPRHDARAWHVVPHDWKPDWIDRHT